MQMVAQIFMLPIFFLLLEMSQAVVLYLLCSTGATRLGFMLAGRAGASIAAEDATAAPPAQLDERAFCSYVSQAGVARAAANGRRGRGGSSPTVAEGEQVEDAWQVDEHVNDLIVHSYGGDSGA